jgi:hypothetical protein
VPTYRYFEHNGKVLDRIDSADGEFGVTPDVAQADVAEALGVPSDAVTVREGIEKPTPQATIPLPEEPPAPPKRGLAALLEAVTEAQTFDEFKSAVAGINL